MERKSTKILLIDGENILHQSFHKFEKLKSTDGKPSGAIFGFFKSLHMYLTRFDPEMVIITFDNGHSKFRMSLNPNYKGHRKDLSFDRESLQKQKHTILKILGMLRIPYVFDKKKTTDYEGDDFLAKFALEYAINKSKVIIVSSDKDFNQLLVYPNIKIYNPKQECYITHKNCYDIFGYTPEQTVPYLCMVGDKSDDIPGIRGIGPVKAKNILSEVRDFWGEYVGSLSKESRDILDRNRKLIDLRYFVSNFPTTIPVKAFDSSKPIKYSKFNELCIEYSFSSFLTPEFIKPFECKNYGNGKIRQ